MEHFTRGEVAVVFICLNLCITHTYLGGVVTERNFLDSLYKHTEKQTENVTLMVWLALSIFMAKCRGDISVIRQWAALSGNKSSNCNRENFFKCLFVFE